jgi:RNA polymerase sigma-70 factor (ECF subfamily)
MLEASRLSFTDASVDQVDLKSALAKLPHRCQQSVVLYYLCDLSIAEIAEVMGLSGGTVKTHLARGRDTLRGILEVEE